MTKPTARRALVTGGSSGIGRCVAETLARDGCDVAIIFQGRIEDAAPILERVRSYGRRAWARLVDVRSAEQTHEAFESLVAEWGGVDVLVNSAGIFRDQVIWKMTDQQWKDVIDVDLTGVFNCCRAAAPILRKGGWGSIVNVSSINGMRGKFGQTNYCAAKAGVIGLTKALAKELARFNTTVNAVAPGMIDTPILDAMPEAARQAGVQEILLGRVGKPQEVAEAIAFLCSDRARFITGEVLRVDGGQYI